MKLAKIFFWRKFPAMQHSSKPTINSSHNYYLNKYGLFGGGGSCTCTMVPIEIEIQLGIEPRSSKLQSDALTIELLELLSLELLSLEQIEP